MKIKTYNLSEVLATLSSDTNIYGEFRIEGDVNRVFCNIKPAFDANIDSISWVSPNRSDQVKLATNTQAGILVLPFDLNVKPSANQTYIFAENPKLIFATVINNCIENLENLKVHDTAIIDPLAQISSTAQIGAHTLIGNCSIGKGSIIGDNCSILDQTLIGENVKIGSGARIGNLGYGYAIDGNGSHIRFPHLGVWRYMIM